LVALGVLDAVGRIGEHEIIVFERHIRQRERISTDRFSPINR
jgi:hypothetical protein